MKKAIPALVALWVLIPMLPVSAQDLPGRVVSKREFDESAMQRDRARLAEFSASKMLCDLVAPCCANQHQQDDNYANRAR